MEADLNNGHSLEAALNNGHSLEAALNMRALSLAPAASASNPNPNPPATRVEFFLPLPPARSKAVTRFVVVVVEAVEKGFAVLLGFRLLCMLTRSAIS